MLEIGKWFLSHRYTDVYPNTKESSRPLPELLRDHFAAGNAPFQTVLAFGSQASEQWPATAQVVTTPNGYDVQFHIVPISMDAFAKMKTESYSDGLLTVAATAAMAPQFLVALQGGLETTQCSTKKEIVTQMTPDHGAPLTVAFDAFQQKNTTLNTVVSATGDRNVSIRRAGHLHGQQKPSADRISKAAATSRITAGIEVQTVRWSALGNPRFSVRTRRDEHGVKHLVSMYESLQENNLMIDPSLVSAALGFSAQVVGASDREKLVEKILQPGNADAPLREMLLLR
ncbi:hypothetical protein LRY60_00500 [Candidatus Woesebacteria bacterium]|nr:hypothetical protein [Candidatus Woesebacteria bacterium]